MSMYYTEPYLGYYGNVDFSEENQCWHGKILYIQDLITYEADERDDIQGYFSVAVDHYLQMCKEVGDEPNAPCPSHFRSIDDAPRDGTLINLIRPDDQELFEAHFHSYGAAFSAKTQSVQPMGTWYCKVGGWFEPGEVHYWLPIA
jgi:hypothetical protein